MAAIPTRNGAIIIVDHPRSDPTFERLLRQLQDKGRERLDIVTVDLAAAIGAHKERYQGDFALASELFRHAPEVRRSDRWEDNPLAGESWGRSGKRKRQWR